MEILYSIVSKSVSTVFPVEVTFIEKSQKEVKGFYI